MLPALALVVRQKQQRLAINKNSLSPKFLPDQHGIGFVSRRGDPVILYSLRQSVTGRAPTVEQYLQSFRLLRSQTESVVILKKPLG